MSPNVLLLGGHGKIALLLTPRLLARSWNVTSVIRNPAQGEAIQKIGAGHPGQLDILVRSLDDIKSVRDAENVINEAKPDYVVWAAGAGGKGGADRTYAIDRDAASHFIRAAVAVPSVTKFVLISYIASRRQKAPWWTEEDWAAAQRLNTQILPDYFQAKVAADECLTALGRKRVQAGDSKFQAVVFRPGTLTDEEWKGKVKLGKTIMKGGTVSRADAAEVVEQLLLSPKVRGWVDCIEGNAGVEEEVERTVRDGEDAIEGEDLQSIENKFS
ncbi:MAG: hypothetical protein M1825_004656 [Sarcosagium campestre]|nr:MAG: hypothetical protein M1825_004656 [Sarcosagium campestre]